MSTETRRAFSALWRTMAYLSGLAAVAYLASGEPDSAILLASSSGVFLVLEWASDNETHSE